MPGRHGVLPPPTAATKNVSLRLSSIDLATPTSLDTLYEQTGLAEAVQDLRVEDSMGILTAIGSLLQTAATSPMTSSSSNNASSSSSAESSDNNASSVVNPRQVQIAAVSRVCVGVTERLLPFAAPTPLGLTLVAQALSAVAGSSKVHLDRETQETASSLVQDMVSRMTVVTGGPLVSTGMTATATMSGEELGAFTGYALGVLSSVLDSAAGNVTASSGPALGAARRLRQGQWRRVSTSSTTATARIPYVLLRMASLRLHGHAPEQEGVRVTSSSIALAAERHVAAGTEDLVVLARSQHREVEQTTSTFRLPPTVAEYAARSVPRNETDSVDDPSWGPPVDVVTVAYGRDPHRQLPLPPGGMAPQTWWDPTHSRTVWSLDVLLSSSGKVVDISGLDQASPLVVTMPATFLPVAPRGVGATEFAYFCNVSLCADFRELVAAAAPNSSATAAAARACGVEIPQIASALALADRMYNEAGGNGDHASGPSQQVGDEWSCPSACTFFDEEAGNWSDRGCRAMAFHAAVSGSNGTIGHGPWTVECHCTHATSFANARHRMEQRFNRMHRLTDDAHVYLQDLWIIAVIATNCIVGVLFFLALAGTLWAEHTHQRRMLTLVASQVVGGVLLRRSPSSASPKAAGGKADDSSRRSRSQGSAHDGPSTSVLRRMETTDLDGSRRGVEVVFVLRRQSSSLSQEGAQTSYGSPPHVDTGCPRPSTAAHCLSHISEASSSTVELPGPDGGAYSRPKSVALEADDLLSSSMVAADDAEEPIPLQQRKRNKLPPSSPSTQSAPSPAGLDSTAAPTAGVVTDAQTPSAQVSSTLPGGVKTRLSVLLDTALTRAVQQEGGFGYHKSSPSSRTRLSALTLDFDEEAGELDFGDILDRHLSVAVESPRHPSVGSAAEMEPVKAIELSDLAGRGRSSEGGVDGSAWNFSTDNPLQLRSRGSSGGTVRHKVPAVSVPSLSCAHVSGGDTSLARDGVHGPSAMHRTSEDEEDGDDSTKGPTDSAHEMDCSALGPGEPSRRPPRHVVSTRHHGGSAAAAPLVHMPSRRSADMSFDARSASSAKSNATASSGWGMGQPRGRKTGTSYRCLRSVFLDVLYNHYVFRIIWLGRNPWFLRSQRIAMLFVAIFAKMLVLSLLFEFKLEFSMRAAITNGSQSFDYWRDQTFAVLVTVAASAVAYRPVGIFHRKEAALRRNRGVLLLRDYLLELHSSTPPLLPGRRQVSSSLLSASPSSGGTSHSGHHSLSSSGSSLRRLAASKLLYHELVRISDERDLAALRKAGGVPGRGGSRSHDTAWPVSWPLRGAPGLHRGRRLPTPSRRKALACQLGAWGLTLVYCTACTFFTIFFFVTVADDAAVNATGSQPAKNQPRHGSSGGRSLAGGITWLNSSLPRGAALERPLDAPAGSTQQHNYREAWLRLLGESIAVWLCITHPLLIILRTSLWRRIPCFGVPTRLLARCLNRGRVSLAAAVLADLKLVRVRDYEEVAAATAGRPQRGMGAGGAQRSAGVAVRTKLTCGDMVEEERRVARASVLPSRAAPSMPETRVDSTTQHATGDSLYEDDNYI